MPNFFDQFDGQMQARIAPVPKTVAPNFFDQFDEPAEPAQQPVDTPERRALQAELDKRLAASDEAGRVVAQREAVAETARPFLRGATDLADGALSLPKLAAAVPIGALNLAGANIRSPLTYSLKELGSDGGRSLQPRNDNEVAASSATQALGSVLGGLGAGGVLARGVGASANVGKVLAANPGLQTAGAVTGAGAGEVARRSGAGAVGQTVASVVGGLVPSSGLQGTLRTANKAAQGLTRTPEAQRLLDAGVDLTPGQLNPKGVINQLEESWESVPLVGQVIKGARDNAKEGYRRAVVQEGAAPGTTIAQGDQASMLDEAYQSFQPLYDQAKGFPVAPQIVNAGSNTPLTAAISSAVAARGVRATAADREAVQGFLDDQLTRRVATSDDLLEMRSAVRAEARDAASQGDRAQAQLLRNADDAITQALESQLPADALRALRTADAKYGQYKTLEKAVAGAKDRQLSPTDVSNAVASSGRGVGQGGYARGGGGNLRELASAGKAVFDTKSPPTGARLAAIGVPAAAAATNPVALGAGATVLGAIGTRTGRRLAQGATAPQQVARRALQPAQRLIADPYQEQLALALQQAIEMQKRRKAEGQR